MVLHVGDNNPLARSVQEGLSATHAREVRDIAGVNPVHITALEQRVALGMYGFAPIRPTGQVRAGTRGISAMGHTSGGTVITGAEDSPPAISQDTPNRKLAASSTTR